MLVVCACGLLDVICGLLCDCVVWLVFVVGIVWFWCLLAFASLFCD